MPTHVVILAAGQGKRMNSGLPKVAHLVAGRPMVNWVLRSVAPLTPASTVVVVGHGADQVKAILPAGTITAWQEQQLGTGHATKVGLAALSEIGDDDVVVILYGDTPMLSAGLIGRLANFEAGETGRLVTTRQDDPTGYGRVIRDHQGEVAGIVEERDCTPEQRLIDEVNAGIYAVRAGRLLSSLESLRADNSQGEFYLTDVVGILVSEGDRLVAVEASPEEVSGINSQDHLAAAQKILQQRINQHLMDSGVWMLDPERTYIADTVEVAPGARIYPGVYLEGSTSVAAGATVGPDVHAVDSTIGPNSTVRYAVLNQAEVGEDCQVGPYASLRPGTVMRKGSKLGTFVEAKNTTLGEGAKANHLSYLGDATVGARSNIGAGSVTLNYDGDAKHQTEIGEDVKIGGDTMLVAPVKVGDGAYTGAGAVIRTDVPDGALGVSGGEQRNIPDYAERRKAQKARKDAED